MPENKEIETMLAQTSREETKEILNFIQTLMPYEKREFIGIMQGAKMVKMWQAEQEEAELKKNFEDLYGQAITIERYYKVTLLTNKVIDFVGENAKIIE